MTSRDTVYYDPSGFSRLAAAQSWLFWFTARNELICWMVKRHFPQAHHFCEIGCGSGAVLKAIAHDFPNMEITGIDIYPEALRWAKNAVPRAHLVEGDILHLPPEGIPGDVAGIFDVLEHIPADAAALQKVHAILKPGAGLIVTVPQHPELWSIADEIGRHCRRYRRDELVTRTQSAGFEVLHLTSFVFLLLPVLWLKRKRTREPDDAYAELQIGRGLNFILKAVMKLEMFLIRIGFPLPWGGSLILVARRK